MDSSEEKDDFIGHIVGTVYRIDCRRIIWILCDFSIDWSFEISNLYRPHGVVARGRFTSEGGIGDECRGNRTANVEWRVLLGMDRT